MVARIVGSGPTAHITYIHHDHLGSASVATDAAGAVAWRESYTPFGEAMQNPAANTDNQGFTGHIQDTATGLNYMQARYYDPVIGRFLSNDPVGFAQGGPEQFNRYVYAENDPVNMIDPDGKDGVNLFVFAAARAQRDGVSLQTATASANEDMKASIIYYANVDGIMALGDGGGEVSVNLAVETIGGLIPSGGSVSVTSPLHGTDSVDGAAYAAGINVGAQLNDLGGFHSPATTVTVDALIPGGSVSLPDQNGNGAGVEIGIGYGASIARTETRTDPVIALRTPWSPGFKERGPVEVAFDE